MPKPTQSMPNVNQNTDSVDIPNADVNSNLPKQPDPMAEDELDKILEAVENNGALYNGDIPMTLTPPMSRIKAKAAISAYTTNKIIEELENIKGRKFTDDEMMGMDSKNAQAARAINAFVDDIDKRIAALNHRKDN